MATYPIPIYSQALHNLVLPDHAPAPHCLQYVKEWGSTLSDMEHGSGLAWDEGICSPHHKSDVHL